MVCSFLKEGLNEKLTREKQTERLSNMLCIQCKLLQQSNTVIDEDGDDEFSSLFIGDDDDEDEDDDEDDNDG